MSGAGADNKYRALLAEAVQTIEKLQGRVAALERERAEPIAIIGMACRFPGGCDTPEAFWDLLARGGDAITEVPADRWDVNEYYDPDPDAPGRAYSRWGGFIDRVSEFDASFFGISRREALTLDPQQRLLLETSWEALERAGQSPEKLAGTAAGVFVGISGSEYAELVKAATGETRDIYGTTGNSMSIAAGRLAYVLGLQGPCMAIDTACSSSLVSVHVAVRSLRTRECHLALAGGVNLMLTPTVTIATCKGRMLSFDGRCKTFDAAADGYVRGEGAGMVVLKRLSDAIASGDPVLAIIRGSATNQDGRSSGLTAPNGEAQRALLRAALKDAGVSPERVSYIEAHGTGTSLGDPIEVRALGEVFGGRAADRPLLIGSVKTNFGHLESAAGIAGLIKGVLVLQHRAVPPHLHFRTPSPHIAWGQLPIEVPTALTALVGTDPLAVGVSSFGFSGTNAHVVLEEAGRDANRTESALPAHVLTLSAPDRTALAAVVDRYADYLRTERDVSLDDVCFTASAGRSHFAERIAVTARSRRELEERLRTSGSGEVREGMRRGTLPATRPKVAFLFTGQGSQYVGMGRQLFEAEPAFADVLKRCDEWLRPRLPRPLLSVLYPEAGQEAEMETVLGETQFTQPALFAFEMALASMWQAWGIEPGAVAGHSVGEFVAACVAGSYTLEEGLALVTERARLMQALPRGGAMAAIFASEEQVAQAVAEYAGSVAIAAINGPANVVLSGAAGPVDETVKRFEAAGVRCRRLAVSHAFHSPLVQPAVEPFREAASGFTPRPPRLRVISNVSGRSLSAGESMDARYWARHLRQPVRFAESIASLREHGYNVFIEIGPSPVLIGMAQQGVNDPDVKWVPSLRRRGQDWECAADALAQLYVAGVPVAWDQYYRARAPRRTVLPTYPFQRQRFWVQQTESSAGEPRRQEDPLRDWLYRVDWQPSAAPTPSLPLGTILLIADDDAAAVSLADRLTTAGRRCVIVRSGTDYAFDRDAGTVDPTRKEDFARLLDACRRTGPLAGVVYIAGVSEPRATLEAIERTQQRLSGGVLAMAQALIERPTSDAAALVVVTRGAQAVAGESSLTVRPEQGTLWGLGRVIALEQPALRCTLVDLDPAGASNEADALADEILGIGEERQIGWRGARRFVARLVRASDGDFATSGANRFSPDVSYLITGGCGGLGLRVAQWMVGRGARHMVLTSRSGPSPQAADAIHAMTAAGAIVSSVRADVSVEADLRRTLDTIVATPYPLRGVIHAAGVLDDGLIGDQTWQRFAAVMAPKVRGAWLLDQLTRDQTLDFFVLFSSTASVLGSVGQANYASANAYLDALADKRRLEGLPALSINWGPWEDVGMAARLSARERARIALRGFPFIPPPEGLRVLDRLLAVGRGNIIAMPARWRDLLQGVEVGAEPALLKVIATEVARRQPTARRDSQISGLRARLDAAAPGQRPGIMQAFLRAELARVLGAEHAEELNADASFGALGVDSLMALELRNALSSALARPVPSSAVFEYPSIDALATHLLSEPAQAVATVRRAADHDTTDAVKLLSNLDQLSDEAVDALLSQLATEKELPG